LEHARKRARMGEKTPQQQYEILRPSPPRLNE